MIEPLRAARARRGFLLSPVKLFLIFFCAASLLPFRAAQAHKAPSPEDLKDVALDDRTGKKLPGDLEFADEHGARVRLSGYADRPTLLLPIYYSCKHVCADMLGNLAVSLGKVPLRAGRDYRVLALSIDETEAPALALEAKGRYRSLLPKGFAENDWKFLTGDAASIKRFSGASGYRFRRTGKREFSHPNVLIVLGRDGTIIRYIYGPDFLPFDMGMALTEAAKGTPSLPIRKILSYCFTYDPEKKTYTFRAAQVLGLSFSGFMGVGLYFLLRKKRRAAGDTGGKA